MVVHLHSFSLFCLWFLYLCTRHVLLAEEKWVVYCAIKEDLKATLTTNQIAVCLTSVSHSKHGTDKMTSVLKA